MKSFCSSYTQTHFKTMLQYITLPYITILYHTTLKYAMLCGHTSEFSQTCLFPDEFLLLDAHYGHVLVKPLPGDLWGNRWSSTQQVLMWGLTRVQGVNAAWRNQRDQPPRGREPLTVVQSTQGELGHPAKTSTSESPEAGRDLCDVHHANIADDLKPRGHEE